MLSPLTKALCRHDYYWSERHGAERCRRCTKLRSTPSADFLATDFQATGFQNLSTTPASETETAPAQVVDFPTLVTVDETLKGRIEALAAGAVLDRHAVLLLVQALIEDAQSADPQIAGATAVELYARLYAASQQG